MTSIGSYGKLQICPPDGTTCHGHAYISWTDIGHAHNEDNDEDKKNFNKLNTKFYTIVVTHWLFFLHLLGACAPNNLIPVTIFYGLIPDNAIKSLSSNSQQKKNNPYCIIWHLYVCTVCPFGNCLLPMTDDSFSRFKVQRTDLKSFKKKE